MKKFKELDKRKVSEVENSILESWVSIDNMHNSQVELNKDNKPFVFYDGPAFANGFPGLHHMVAKNLKDTVTKYHSMNGEKVIRKIGWDTHGLPIENHVEKKLGISSKKEIETLGIDKFNLECRKSVRENEDAFTRLTSKMGQFFNTENPYLTYKNEYIETEWWILKNMYDKGLFYEGTRVVPYCPHCGTGLATHEVAQNYQNDTALTCYVPFKKRGEDVYFLAWTTTPWTLLANLALCVNANEDYVQIKSNDNKFILAKALVDTIFEDYEVIKEYKGSELENMEYEQLIPEINVEGEAFKVLCDDYVTMSDGTGVVHIAPAFGEDDSRVCQKYGITFVNPVGLDGNYTEGPWKGKFVFDVNEEVVSYLKEQGKLFKKQKITHEYPHCWRCDTPLIYYSMPSYYVKVSAMVDDLVKANSEVNWYPAYVGEKRFANWLANARDWNVSRSRFWGAPIPYFKCECGYNHMVGSVEELKNMATTNISDDFDLHKPYIDNVYLKCPKCGKDMKRIPEVLDCWFDSGSMPFAQYHYPFENKELFEEQFPADFICEGIDQTRGWFYTLMVISTFVKGTSPFKNVLVNDLLLDSEGKKMSKSRGNIVEPFATIEEYGADTVRFYLPYVSSVWTPLKFDMDGLKEVYSKFFNPLKNTYSFFQMYANIDEIDTDDCNIDIKDREEIDKWLISKYNRLVKEVNADFAEYDLNKYVHHLTYFVSEDLSNWYIRRNRNRFWGSKFNDSKKAVYITTYEVLVGLTKLMAPICPYISEEMFRNLTGKKSVHFESFPKHDENLINEELENKMDLVRSLISSGRALREENKIKVKMPLSKALIDGKNEKILSNLVNLIKEELNVKEVEFVKNLNEYMSVFVKPNFKEVGKVFGPNIKEYQEKLLNLTDEEIINLQNEKAISMTISGSNYEITSQMVDIRYEAKEGFNVGSEKGNFIILNTTLTDDLIMEGTARELVSKIQSMRKEAGFEIENRINITYNADEKMQKVIENFNDYIKNETLTVNLSLDSSLELDTQINSQKVAVKLELA